MQSDSLSIHEKENELFNSWRTNRPGFVADGIVDENVFFKAPKKILLVLKEVNDEGGGSWDLRDYIAGKMENGPRKQTWQAVSRWIYGINKLPAIDDWDYIEYMPYDRIKGNLKQIIAVNMNKSPGSHTSKTDKLWNEGTTDIDYFRTQMEFYQVDYTICCGINPFWYLRRALEINIPIEMSKNGVQYFFRDRLGIIIKFNHPEARVGENFLFYSLMHFLNEIHL